MIAHEFYFRKQIINFHPFAKSDFFERLQIKIREFVLSIFSKVVISDLELYSRLNHKKTNFWHFFVQEEFDNTFPKVSESA